MRETTMTILMDGIAPGEAETAVDNGEPAGDCLRASVAAILDMDPEHVPHFAQYRRPADSHLWWWALVGFCYSMGWDVTVEAEPPQGWSLVSGMSPRGHQHMCVGYDGEVVFDPHPSRAGLVDIREWFAVRRLAAQPTEEVA